MLLWKRNLNKKYRKEKKNEITNDSLKSVIDNNLEK